MRNGYHGLYYEVYDAEGNKTIGWNGQYLVVNSDTTAPTISITSPSNGDTINGSVEFQGEVLDVEGSIKTLEIYFDDALVGTKEDFNQQTMFDLSGASLAYLFRIDTESSFLALADGVYTVTLKAYDYAGNVTTETMQLTVANNVSPCINHSATNMEHVAAGRAIAGGVMDMYAITVGGEDDLGLIGTTWYSEITDVKETTPGFFEAGVCAE